MMVTYIFVATYYLFLNAYNDFATIAYKNEVKNNVKVYFGILFFLL